MVLQGQFLPLKPSGQRTTFWALARRAALFHCRVRRRLSSIAWCTIVPSQSYLYMKWLREVQQRDEMPWQSRYLDACIGFDFTSRCRVPNYGQSLLPEGIPTAVRLTCKIIIRCRLSTSWWGNCDLHTCRQRGSVLIYNIPLCPQDGRSTFSHHVYHPKRLDSPGHRR